MATVLAASFGPPFAAQPKPAVDCDDAASTPEIAICAAGGPNEADLELNAVDRTVLAAISRQSADAFGPRPAGNDARSGTRPPISAGICLAYSAA